MHIVSMSGEACEQSMAFTLHEVQQTGATGLE